MFGSMPDERSAGGGPAARVSFAALAARPHRFEAAFHVVQLAIVARRGAADAEATADTDTDEAVAVEHDLVDQVAALERVKSRGEAAQLRAMAELAARPMFAGCTEHGFTDARHGVRGAASVVSAELRLSPAAAVTRVALACELAGELPATLAALDAGRIDGYRARVIAEQTRPSDRCPSCAGRWRPRCWSGRISRPPPNSGQRPARRCWQPTRPARPSGTRRRGPAGSCPPRARNWTAWPACSSGCPPKTPSPSTPPSTPPPA